MKNYNQNKKTKEEFLKKSALAAYMKGDANKVFTREELSEDFGLCDREIRAQVAELANYLPVLSLSSKKGYRVLTFDEKTPLPELMKMYKDAEHQIAELRSRIDNLKARMKPLIAFQKVIEKKISN